MFCMEKCVSKSAGKLLILQDLTSEALALAHFSMEVPSIYLYLSVDVKPFPLKSVPLPWGR
jgi:hypothetical protein